MTPLNFVPTAPPSRPVAPAGGGVAEPPSLSSFESALQRAGASDDSPRPAAGVEAKPVAGKTSDRPVTKSSGPQKLDDVKDQASDVAESDDVDASAPQPARLREGATRVKTSREPQLRDSLQQRGAAAEAPVTAAVPVQVPQSVAGVQPVDEVEAGVARARAAGPVGAPGHTPQANGDSTLLAPQSRAQRRASSEAAATDVTAPGGAADGDVRDAFEGALDRDGAVDARAAQAAPRLMSAARPDATPAHPSSQAARTLLADALQASAASNQQALASTPIHESVSRASVDAAAASGVPLRSQNQGAVTAEPMPAFKAAQKSQAQTPWIQEVQAPAATGTHDGAGAGNGGASAGFGRRETVPVPHAKTDSAMTWPTAFAVRIPEAMSSSLERTGSAPATLPAAVTQQDLSNVGPQLVRGLQMQANAGGGDLKMTLNPEHLGSVTIEVQVRNARVSATLTAETPEVRQWIATHQADLKNSLASVGLSLEDLVVKDEGGGGRQDSAEQRQPQSGRRQAARDEENEPQFEVLV